MDTQPEKKRLYVSGLFDGVKREDLVEKFSRFGEVESVDLKARRNEDEQTNNNYAFLEMLITLKNLAKCFNVYSNTRWKGCPLKVEVAKESFLSRLQKEREQAAKKPQPSTATSSDTSEQKPTKNVVTFDKEERVKSRKRPADSSSQLESVSPDAKTAKKLKHSNDHDMNGHYVANQKPQDSSLLSRLEKFSGTWNDFEVVGTQQVSRKSDLTLKSSDGSEKRQAMKVVTFDDESDDDSVKNIKPPVTSPSPIKNSKHKAPMLRGTATLLQDKASDSVSADKKAAKNVKLNHSFPAKTGPLKQSSVPSSSVRDIAAKNFPSNGFRSTQLPDLRNGQRLSSQKPNGSDLSSRLEKFSGIWNDFEVVGSEAKTSLGPVSEKKMLSDQKRLESIHSKLSQSNAKQKLIKDSLKSLDEGTKVNSKIVFDDEIEDKKTVAKLNAPEKQSKKKSRKDSKEQQDITLFDSDSEEDLWNSQEMFQVKPQYEGEAGQKIMALQSRFGNDDRFKIDERFIEADSEGEKDEEVDSKHETERQMGVLASVLGYELPKKPKDKLTEGRTNKKQLRYDPTLKNAAELEIHQDEQSDAKASKRKGKAKQVSEEDAVQVNDALPEVSQERYYKVSTSLKDIFSSGKKSENESFSLLQTFGTVAPSKDTHDQPDVAHDKAISLPRTDWDNNPFKYDSSSDEEGETVLSSKGKKKLGNKKTAETSSAAPAKSKPLNAARKTFFIFDGDKRLEDGVKFFIAPDNQDEVHQTWGKTRFKLMEEFRERLKKAQQETSGKTKMASAAKQKFDVMKSKFRPKKKVFRRKRQ